MYLKQNDYYVIRDWMYRNARPLDLARFHYHFENGSKYAVLVALSIYQNTDGGFGHGLEIDNWNPDSSPIQTWKAIEILMEIGFTDRNHPIIKGILNYLDNCPDYHDGYWYAQIPSNNDYPHAPWWTYKDNVINEWGYNPTAVLVGFIVRFADNDSQLFEKAELIIKQMIDNIMMRDFIDMHEIGCFITLLDECNEADYRLPRQCELEEKIKIAVHNTISGNTIEWNTTYVCKPSQYFNSPESVYYQDNKKLAEYELDHLVEYRNEDGVWNITWNWGDEYREEFAITKNWWKGDIVIKYLLILRNYNRLVLN